MKDYASLGDSLRRVKIGERPLDEGGKKVWHQGEQGIDVVSFVDAQGRVYRQELYLGDEVVVWQAHKPAFTGQVSAEARNTPGIARSELVVQDAQPGRATVEHALALLRGNHGDDRYLAHLRDALAAVAQGLTDDEDSVVTSMQQKVTDPRAEVTAPTPAPSNAAFYVAVGAVVVGLAAGGLYLAFIGR